MGCTSISSQNHYQKLNSSQNPYFYRKTKQKIWLISYGREKALSFERIMAKHILTVNFSWIYFLYFLSIHPIWCYSQSEWLSITSWIVAKDKPITIEFEKKIEWNESFNEKRTPWRISSSKISKWRTKSSSDFRHQCKINDWYNRSECSNWK